MSDSRSPITDALETLGMIHYKPEKRDAIHLAVEPVVAAYRLIPGQKIGIHNGKAYPMPDKENPYGYALLDDPDKTMTTYHGIVDPFLQTAVLPGQSFWFVMKPREVRSLRHVWSHPDFPEGT